MLDKQPLYLPISSHQSAKVRQLLIILQGNNPDARRRAARILAQMGPPEAIEELFYTLEHPIPEVVAWAAWVLAQMGGKQVLQGFGKGLGSSSTLVRAWAAWGLGQVATMGDFTNLEEALHHDDGEVQWRIAIAIGKMASLPAIKALLRELENNRDPYVRGRIAEALGKTKVDLVIPILVRLLDDSEALVREQAAYALGEMGTEEAIFTLLKNLSHPDPEVRCLLVAVLSFLGQERFVTYLLKALEDDNSWVRSRAIDGLIKLGTNQALTGVKLALNDPDKYVRLRAHSALEKFECLSVLTPPPKPKSSLFKPLPHLIITDYTEASIYFSHAEAFGIKGAISIGSPGVPVPVGYHRLLNPLRLEFHDIDVPENDPNYTLATLADLERVKNLVSYPFEGLFPIHCQAGISRSAAIALAISAQILGEGHEQEALEYILTVRPCARPNRWLVELADTVLGRKNKLVRALPKEF